MLPTPAGANGHFFKDGIFGGSVIFIGWPIKNKDKVIYVVEPYLINAFSFK